MRLPIRIVRTASRHRQMPKLVRAVFVTVLLISHRRGPGPGHQALRHGQQCPWIETPPLLFETPWISILRFFFSDRARERSSTLTLWKRKGIDPLVLDHAHNRLSGDDGRLRRPRRRRAHPGRLRGHRKSSSFAGFAVTIRSSAVIAPGSA